jgi:hypothetical protein
MPVSEGIDRSMASQPPPVLRIGYRMQRGDYVALCRALQPKPIRRTLIEIAIFAVMFLALLCAVSGFDWRTFQQGLGALVSLNAPWWVYLILLFGLVLALSHSQWVALVAALNYRRHALADKDVTLSFDGNGVTATSPNLTSEIGWEAFLKLVETPTHAFLAVSRREALIVPRRAFADEDDHLMLMGFIRARLAANIARQERKTAA